MKRTCVDPPLCVTGLTSMHPGGRPCILRSSTTTASGRTMIPSGMYISDLYGADMSSGGSRWCVMIATASHSSLLRRPSHGVSLSLNSIFIPGKNLAQGLMLSNFSGGIIATVRIMLLSVFVLVGVDIPVAVMVPLILIVELQNTIRTLL